MTVKIDLFYCEADRITINFNRHEHVFPQKNIQITDQRSADRMHLGCMHTGIPAGFSTESLRRHVRARRIIFYTDVPTDGDALYPLGE